LNSVGGQRKTAPRRSGKLPVMEPPTSKNIKDVDRCCAAPGRRVDVESPWGGLPAHGCCRGRVRSGAPSASEWRQSSARHLDVRVPSSMLSSRYCIRAVQHLDGRRVALRFILRPPPMRHASGCSVGARKERCRRCRSTCCPHDGGPSARARRFLKLLPDLGPSRPAPSILGPWLV